MMRTLLWSEVDDGAGYPALGRFQVQGPMEVHTHDFFEIIYVLNGFCLHVVNGVSSLLMSGDIVALRPGDAHRYRGQRNVDIVNFLFTAQALGGALPEVLELPGMSAFFEPTQSDPRRMHRHLSLKDREYLLRFFEEMQKERSDQGAGWTLRSKALLVEFMVFFSRVFSAGFSAKGAEIPYMGYVSAAMAEIEQNYHTDLKISDIAERLGISADHLTRQFRGALGITPIEYLRRFRFARALELLRSQSPVGEVCAAVGFHHISHFSREFKALFDMTPTAFQRQSKAREATESMHRKG